MVANGVTAFPDWLTMNAGMPKEMIPNTSNCGKGIVWFAANPNSGSFYFKNAEHKARMVRNYHIEALEPELLTEAESNYVPTPGDYIYFRWQNTATSVNVSHVGIVADVNGCITTWEGNVGGKVVTRSFALGDAQIVGYGHPRYSAANTHTCNCVAA